MIKPMSIHYALLSLCLSFLGSTTVQATPLSAQSKVTLSYDSMLQDIRFLADDKRKGRGNFSNEIHEAAAYIAQRFQQIGLAPLSPSHNFYQPFTVINNQPTSIKATLNEQSILAENLAFISNIPSQQWTNTKQLSISYVHEKDNFRDVINAINQQGGEHVVLVHPAHSEAFTHYQASFKQGKNTLFSSKIKSPLPQSLVLVLSDIKAVSQLNIEALTLQTHYSLNNVVGILPAVKSATQTPPLKNALLISAHYDHLGIHAKNQTIYNGADDNASGTTAVIQLAEFYADQKRNTRPIIFTAFAGEEIGTLGSRYFSQHIPPKSIAAMINIEMIGKASTFGAGKLWMTGHKASELFNILNQNQTHLAVYPDPYPEQALFYRSDNAPFARLGVPAHTFSSSQIDTDSHYHQTSDELSTLNLPSMFKVIENLSRITQPLTKREVTPARIKTNTLENSGKIF